MQSKSVFTRGPQASAPCILLPLALAGSKTTGREVVHQTYLSGVELVLPHNLDCREYITSQ